MALKQLNMVKVKTGYGKGAIVWSTRNTLNGKTIYSLYAQPCKCETSKNSKGLTYDVFTYELYSYNNIKLTSTVCDKATVKINGFYENIVEFVANEFKHGVRHF